MQPLFKACVLFLALLKLWNDDPDPVNGVALKLLYAGSWTKR